MEDKAMAMDMLKQLAGSPLPATFRTRAEIDQIKLLRAAGLVIALTPAPSDPLTLSGSPDAAQVLAITEKGRAELERIHYPVAAQGPWRGAASRWRAKLPHAIRTRLM
jgi:hypothetical protein